MLREVFELPLVMAESPKREDGGFPVPVKDLSTNTKLIYTIDIHALV
jgi:hypothetical protein